MENDALEEESSNNKKTINVLNQSKTDIQRDVQELNEMCTKLKDTLNKAKLQNQNTEETLHQTTELLRSVTDQKQSIEDTLKKAQEEKTKQKVDIESQKEQIRKLEREVSSRNAKIKSMERLMALEKEKSLDSEERLRQTLKNSMQTSEGGRVKELEDQVEHLNITNRRVLDINKAVMEENKQLKERLREKTVKARGNKEADESALDMTTPGKPIIGEGKTPTAVPKSSKTPDMIQQPSFDTPKSLTDVSPISGQLEKPPQDSDESLNNSNCSDMSEKPSEFVPRKSPRRKNSPVKHTRTPSLVLEKIAATRKIAPSGTTSRRRQSLNGTDSPKQDASKPSD